jgi:phosphate transport system substrate-binding protein
MRWRLARVAAAAGIAIAAGTLGSPVQAQEPIKAVGSTFVSPFLNTVFDRLVKAGVIVPPKHDYRGTGRGIAEFCRSAAPDSASVVAMSRRMRNAEFEKCAAHGVSDIIEIQLGSNTLVLATRRNDADYNLTLRNLYDAVAREVPKDDEFLPNVSKRWSEVGEGLPDTPIRVVVAAPGLGSRGFFEDRFLEAACRAIPAIKSIFSAESRVKQCVALRADKAVVEVGLPYEQSIRLTMTDAPPGTIAVMPFNMATAMADIVKAASTACCRPVDRRHPTYPSTGRSSSMKKAHVKDYRGVAWSPACAN